MQDSMKNYFRLSIVFSMAYPVGQDNEKILECVRKIALDPDFEAVELTHIEDDETSKKDIKMCQTDNLDVLALRHKLAKNAMAVLLMSRGTPMFLSGDEFLNTQYGNNNAYCQDNEISWLDWSFLEKNRDHFSYTKHMIAFRKAHDVIRKPSGVCSLGLPNIKVIPPAGSTHVLAVLSSGRTRTDTADDLVCLAVNVY